MSGLGHRSGGPSSLLGLALLLLVVAPLTLWRAQLETSLWIDESYSLLAASHPVERLLEVVDLDTHPPLYYLALKAWLKVPRLAGVEPGILWARASGVALWGLLAALAWGAGRRLFGRPAGTLVAWTVAGGAGAALMARELRGYGLATLCLFAAFLVLVATAAEALDRPAAGRDTGADRRRRRRRRLLWGAYAFAATLALWTHLLSGLVLAAASLVWLALLAGRRRLRPALTLPAIAAHLVPIALFSPWLVRAGRQIGYLEGGDPQWMTPATWGHLGHVFVFWYPFSRIGDPAAAGNALLVPLGVATLLAPAGLALLARRRRAAAVEASHPGLRPAPALGAAAAIGLGGAALFVVAIWTLARLDLVPVFHGPRYPLLAVHLWSAGLAALAARAAAALGARQQRPAIAWAALACLPWLAASAVGQARMAEAEAWGELSELRAAAGAGWPSADGALYLMPSELAPFYRRTFAGLDLRRIERLPCDERRGPVHVLDVNPWPQLDRPRDHLVRALLRRGDLGPATEVAAYPPERPGRLLYRLEPGAGAGLEELCRRGLAPPLAGAMAAAASAAHPERLSRDGWSYLEVSPELDLYRWSTEPVAAARFDRPLDPGRYRLHVAGARAPAGAERLTLRLPGIGGHVFTLSEGRFRLCLDLAWPAAERRRPLLELHHPLWRRARPDRPGDRSLGLVFYGAWMTPADPGDDESLGDGCTGAGNFGRTGAIGRNRRSE